MADSLYKQHIIDHYKNPKNEGVIEGADFHSKYVNASCGDEVEVFIKCQDGKVVDVKHLSRGCAISVAATSMLSEKLVGRDCEELMKLENSEVLQLIGMEEHSGRVKCATLGIEAIRKAVVSPPGEIN